MCGHVQSCEQFEVAQGELLPCFSSQTLKKCPFLSLFSARFFVFLFYFFVADFVVENDLQTQCLSTV